MSRWEQLLRLRLLQGGLAELYDRKFPRHIRHSLCLCIESLDWDSAAGDEDKARACFLQLLAFVDEQLQSCQLHNNFLQAPDFAGMRHYLVRHFEDEPRSLALVLSDCLREERKVLASASENQGCERPAVEQQWRQLDNEVTELRRKTLELKKAMKSLEGLYENLDYLQKTWQERVKQHGDLAQSRAVEEACQKQPGLITQKKQVVLRQAVDILKGAEQVVASLTSGPLPEWRRRQQMSCVGAPVCTGLDDLQKWFTAVAEELIQTRRLLQKLQEHNDKYGGSEGSDLPRDTDRFALTLLTRLLKEALVVEKQPVMSRFPLRPLILKTGVRFTATVRFLANHPEFKHPLTVTPVFDKDVEETMTVTGFRHFDFNRDNTKVLDVDTPGGGLVAEFAHMSLKESKARSKGSSESPVGVTEELHLIKFVAKFQHDGLKCDIEASSLPVVVISATSQVSSAWASIMWYNMLSTGEPKNLSVFADPPPLSWQQLAQVLSWQFLSVGQRGLDEDQLSMLRDKIVDDPDGLVHWSRFSKIETNWFWIDGILDLIKRHLLDFWRDGHIMGFVSKVRTRELLNQKQTGTFLLRFSESITDGAITFSWVEHLNGETHVRAVEPYTKQDLKALSLPETIFLYSLRGQGTKTRSPLLYLYPDVPKDKVFGRYLRSPAATPVDASGYIYRKFIPMSDDLSPPQTPPGDMHMDIDLDFDLDTDNEQLLQDLFPFLTSAQETQSAD